MNEAPRRAKPKAKQTGRMFEYRVPKDLMLNGFPAYEDRIEELKELGYKVNRATSKGTYMEIPHEIYEARQRQKVDHFNATRRPPKATGEVVSQTTAKVADVDFSGDDGPGNDAQDFDG